MSSSQQEQEAAARRKREEQRRKQAEESQNYAQEVANGMLGIPSSPTAIAIDIVTPGGLF